MGAFLVEGLYEHVQEPNERELALIETYAQRNPEEISQIYGLELPLLQEERTAFSQTVFL